MTRKDGNAALVALILVLACGLHARGAEAVSRSHIPWKTGRQATFPGGTVDAFGSFSAAPRESILSGDAAALLAWRPNVFDAPNQAAGPGEVHFASDSALDEVAGGGENVVPPVSNGSYQPQAFPPVFAPNETGDYPDDVGLITEVEPLYHPRFAIRFGWWAIDPEGDLTKVGEYQGLEESAPFYDVDTLLSDGTRTVDLFVTGLDKETNQLGLTFFGPQLEADLGYQRYLHRLDHDPLTNIGDLHSGEEIVREDLSVGEDFAIRVQDLKTSFKGHLGEHIKLRLNFRFLRKQGQRQAKTVKHCFGEIPQEFGQTQGNTCHVLNQGQRIDWRTVKFEPVVEGRFGPVHAEYSRPMRLFDQNDQVVTRPFGIHFPTEEPYAFVPENFTQADRLKLGVDLGANTRFYGRMQVGDTHNKFRQTHRRFHGFDLRLTNQSWDRVTLTGYATLNEQINQNVPFFLPEEEEALAVKTSVIPPYGIRRPIDYFRRSVGADASWHPFRYDSTFGGLTFTTGAEQGLIERKFADYVVQEPQQPPGPIIDQERTTYTVFRVGSSMRWSPSLETFVRYRLRVTKDPLFAVNRYYGDTNTSLPTEESLVDVGGTWTLADNFLATATVGLQNSQHRSDVADFTENNYPMTFTLWYAPTPDWSLSAGYGFYSNWIDQNITFPSDTPNVSVGDTRRWSYGGRGRVLSVGGSYAWTRRLTLSGGAQFVWARDTLDPLAPWPDLPSYSDVIVDRTRITGGFDWSLHEQISAYFRYIFEDYEDESVAFNSGTAHMFLTGVSAVY